jgi:hypothetical protein
VISFNDPAFASQTYQRDKMIRTALLFAAAALLATGASAAPLNVSGLMSQQTSNVDRVRLVCDQDCRCWRTGYIQRGYHAKADPREYQDPNYCPAGGYYNGYYRTGPGTGLGFESRFPVRSLPFPF